MNFLVIFALIAGVANASISEFGPGIVKTHINGPSGSIVQETSGSSIVTKSLPIGEAYAPAYPVNVAIPEPVLPEPVVVPGPTAVYGSPALPVPAPIVAEPAFAYASAYSNVIPEPLAPSPLLQASTPLVSAPAPLFAERALAFAPGHVRTISEPLFAAPSVRVPAPVIAEPALSYAPAYPAVVPERFAAVPFPAPAIRAHHSVPIPSPVVPVPEPTFIRSGVAVSAPAPLLESFKFPLPSPIYAERVLPSSYAVAPTTQIFSEPAFAPVAPVAVPEPVYAARAFPEFAGTAPFIRGYSAPLPAPFPVPAPAVEYGLYK